MSIFNGTRLAPGIFQLDTARLAGGWYSDTYFSNIATLLDTLAATGYRLPAGTQPEVAVGDLEVEMQVFTRRKPMVVVAGVDEALAVLQAATGVWEAGAFHNTAHTLQVEAVQDGVLVPYGGNPRRVLPVLRIRGRYRDFARLETPILGALAETTRVATNVFEVLEAAGGKDVLFFPARFAHYKLQALHGYAYSIAVQAYHRRHGAGSGTFVSTDEQGAWWGGHGAGTISHSAIACFLGNTAETMVQFCTHMPVEMPRIALVDFHNDCVGDTLRVMERLFMLYLNALRREKPEEAAKYRLYAVRPDTGATMRDVSLAPLGDRRLDCGVNPRLVHALRTAIDAAHSSWTVPFEYLDEARRWCRDVKIVVTGGFAPEKIRQFEAQDVPVDIYGVGSWLLSNSSAEGTNSDYTADIVRVRVEGRWLDMAKTGRGPGDHAALEAVAFSTGAEA